MAPLNLEFPALRTLSERDQWVVWKRETRQGKVTKVPYQPNAKPASTTNPKTWSSFESCFECFVHKPQVDGVGYVFAVEDPYSGVDLDHCIRADGTLEPWAAKAVALLDSYTEKSPSGEGLHTLVEGRLPVGGRRHQGLEVYSAGRYFTVTGDHWPGTPEAIEPRQAQLEQLVERFLKPDFERKNYTFRKGWDGTLPQAVQQLAEKNARIRHLLQDPLNPDEYGSDSEADLALASLLVREGMQGQEVQAALQSRRVRLGLHSKHPRYYELTVGLALRKKESDEEAHCSDLGNARRLVRQFGDRLHFVHPWNRWLVWDGRRWKLDEEGRILQLARDVVRAIGKEASEEAEPESRKALHRHALRSESQRSLQAMVTLAATEPGIPVLPEDLDSEPWVLNTQSGVFDFRSFTLEPPDPLKRLTRCVEVGVDRAAHSPLWTTFLDRILPDPKVRDFVQRAVGYSFTGSTEEQVLFLCYGTGANGKTVFLETLLSLAGDYGLKLPSESLLLRNRDSIPNDLAKLPGRRFIAAAETPENARLHEARVKELAGGDRIAARFMRGEWFEFSPVGKLWIATNHKPQVRGDDEGIWRRMRLLPFTVRIPDEEQDRKLLSRLQEHLVGVLAWVLEGAEHYRLQGLQAPEAVTQATAGYRLEEDAVSAFFEEECVEGIGHTARAAELYERYREWVKRNGEGDPLSQRKLAGRLHERGYRREKDGSGRIAWKGVGLIASEDPHGGEECPF